jgi:ketosteroid isomerase-like protein
MLTSSLERPSNTSDDHAALMELNRGYVRAAQNADAAWYDRNLDADFMASNPDGSLVDRATFLAHMAKPQTGKNLEAVNVKIRFFGDLGLIHSGFRKLQADGLERTGCYTDIWAKRNGQWRCVAAHFAMH